jgi:citrate lyase beta subunit
MTNPIFINAELQGADVFILDLEDSVHYAGKDAARILVRTCVPLISANANARFASIGYSGAVDPAEVIPEVADVVLIPAVDRRNK